MHSPPKTGRWPREHAAVQLRWAIFGQFGRGLGLTAGAEMPAYRLAVESGNRCRTDLFTERIKNGWCQQSPK